MTAVGDESEETVDFIGVLWLRHVLDCLDFLWIRRYSLSAEDVPEVLNAAFAELAFVLVQR